MKKDVFTVPEVAKICRISRQTVHLWVKNGNLKAFRPAKNAVWRITRKDLVKYMTKNGIPMEFLKEMKIRILVVDDEINITKAIARAFHDEERFFIESANSGFTAGTKLGEFEPDVVVLDIFLGDMDGRELFDYIKNHPELNGIKVIGISGMLAEKDIKQVLEQGFHAFLQKPFEMRKLKDVILEVVEA